MQVIQGVLIVLLSMWMVLDQQGIVITTWFPIMVAFFAGLIMGDMKTAMIIGGTFQLMNLGVANIGGSSVPNWGLATVVGMLGIQLDVFAKLLNTYVTHAAQKACNEKKFGKMNRILWIGPMIFALSTGLPTALCVLFGDAIVNVILKSVPVWFTNGLSIAGNMLPVVGIALLLQVMPAKKYLSMLMIGFVFSAYLNVPMLGVSIIGLAIAYYFFTTQVNKAPAVAAEGAVIEEGDDWDE